LEKQGKIKKGEGAPKKKDVSRSVLSFVGRQESTEQEKKGVVRQPFWEGVKKQRNAKQKKRMDSTRSWECKPRGYGLLARR